MQGHHTPLYDQVRRDLKICPSNQQGHDRRVKAIINQYRSKLRNKHLERKQAKP